MVGEGRQQQQTKILCLSNTQETESANRKCGEVIDTQSPPPPQWRTWPCQAAHCTAPSLVQYRPLTGEYMFKYLSVWETFLIPVTICLMWKRSIQIEAEYMWAFEPLKGKTQEHLANNSKRNNFSGASHSLSRITVSQLEAQVVPVSFNLIQTPLLWCYLLPLWIAWQMLATPAE